MRQKRRENLESKFRYASLNAVSDTSNRQVQDDSVDPEVKKQGFKARLQGMKVSLINLVFA